MHYDPFEIIDIQEYKTVDLVRRNQFQSHGQEREGDTSGTKVSSGKFPESTEIDSVSEISSIKFVIILYNSQSSLPTQINNKMIS